jgi:hypothetical protein
VQLANDLPALLTLLAELWGKPHQFCPAAGLNSVAIDIFVMQRVTGCVFAKHGGISGCCRLLILKQASTNLLCHHGDVPNLTVISS